MKLLRKTVITEIDHDDLVNLFSTALTGSDMLGCEYDKEAYAKIPPEKTIGDCFEDRIADTLLNGGKVYVYDYYAVGEVYGGKGKVMDDGSGDGIYEIGLQDIVNGLQAAANGSFKWSDDSEEKCALQSFDAFADTGDWCEFDIEAGENLMQIILFNELIYE